MKARWWILLILLVGLGSEAGQIASEIESIETPIESADANTDQHSESTSFETFPTETTTGDFDHDGVSNAKEKGVYGTNPFAADTDQDGLSDGTEIRGQNEKGGLYASSNPLHKDLYVHIYWSPEIQPLSERELKNLKSIWASMPVKNPDSELGITIHVIYFGKFAGQLPNKVRSQGKNDSGYLGGRVCDARLLLLVPIEDETLAGYASAPGYISVVDGHLTDRRDSVYTKRVATITHELLHNIVGTLEGKYAMDPYHSFEGWLAGSLDELGPEPYGSNTYMSNITKNNLNSEGMKNPVCSAS